MVDGHDDLANVKSGYWISGASQRHPTYFSVASSGDGVTLRHKHLVDNKLPKVPLGSVSSQLCARPSRLLVWPLTTIVPGRQTYAALQV